MIAGIATTTPPAATGASADKQKLDSDLDRFLKLLITQLQNQDPLKPLEANEFTSQLVQFANVEQQIAQNANLERLIQLQEAAQAGTMLGYLGQRIEIAGNEMALQGGRADATYTLPESVSAATLRISDRLGRVVYSGDAATQAGRHAFTWDGRGSDGQTLPDGIYTVDVIGRRPDGTFVPATTTVLGVVNGVNVAGGAGTLYVNDLAVPIDRMIAVRPPHPAAATNN